MFEIQMAAPFNGSIALRSKFKGSNTSRLRFKGSKAARSRCKWPPSLHHSISHLPLTLSNLSHSNQLYFTPVCPKPPSPLSVTDNVSTSFQVICSNLAIIICAIRSPGSSLNGSSERFTKITFISPR